MSWLTDAITGWFRETLIDGIIFNFTHMFTEANREINEVAAQVGQTPAGWNAGIFSLIQALSETVIIPIAGVILTFILCYELIHMIIERNNMHDFETFLLFKWVFKSFCAVYILTNTFNIVLFVFALAQNVVDGSAGIITGSLDMDMALADLAEQLEAMGLIELVAVYFQSALLTLAMNVLSLVVFLIIYGRMIEIYLVISVAPIPMATMVNREWGNIGSGYLKSLFALAFQGFLIMLCLAIYAVLLQGIASAENVHIAMWGAAGYTALLAFMLFKTGSLAKSLFSAS